MSQRPDWASGPEWEGWEPFVLTVTRSSPAFDMAIGSDGGLHVWPSLDSGVCIPFHSPESALRVANCIAAEMGGWS